MLINVNKMVSSTNVEKVYLNDIDNKMVEEIFSNPTKYVFRHEDCPYVFATDGDCIFALDMDERGVDPIAKYGVDNIMYIYNDFNEFIDTFKVIQGFLEGRELCLSSHNSMIKISITDLELNFKNLKKSA